MNMKKFGATIMAALKAGVKKGESVDEATRMAKIMREGGASDTEIEEVLTELSKTIVKAALKNSKDPNWHPHHHGH